MSISCWFIDDVQGMKQSKPIGGLSVGRRPQAPQAPQAPTKVPPKTSTVANAKQQQTVRPLQKEVSLEVSKPLPIHKNRDETQVKHTSRMQTESTSTKRASETHFTTVPIVRPFPNSIAPSILRILDGIKLEPPFTTEMAKEFPPRGAYACIRCQRAIVAATLKAPFDFGYSGFLSFNTSSCNIVCSATDDGIPFLQARCEGCNGLMGELVQRKNTFGKLVDALKANSCCLHFVDSDATLLQPKAALNGDTSSDDLEMMLSELDFDDLDVIGTSDGADKSLNKRRLQHETWRRCVSVEALTIPGANVTAEQRHKGSTAALNEHTSSDESDVSEDSSDENEA
ncbi:Hypothetical protein, putative [Bodo saltans]|uniref:Mis18 domain-containing protein n=1 Tax=Bodo saltans TaxID=75058 RepID=A0A0S4JEZ7_BODSA|nr:Hypothetical protein, putative [Bodo saltans]|eukprot:CUG89962.1 Hypothetical protein, putative [Bodo saltans]